MTASAYIVSPGQELDGITLQSGDSMQVQNGGEAVGTTVLSGGFIVNDGVTSATNVNGGNSFVDAGAVAVSTTVNGGYDEVSAGGTESNTKVNAGGYLIVYSGGTALNLVISGYNAFADIYTTISGVVVGLWGQENVISTGIDRVP